MEATARYLVDEMNCLFDEEESNLRKSVKNLQEEERILVDEAKGEAAHNLLEMTTMMENHILMVTGAQEKDKKEMKSALSGIEKIIKELKEELLKLMNELNLKATSEMEKLIKKVTDAQRKEMHEEMQKLLDKMQSNMRKEMEAKIRKTNQILLFVLIPIFIIIICVRAFSGK